MADYTQLTDFSAKDSLPSGDQNKLIKGSDVDAEFDAISTAISSKEDAANKGQASGYAELDSGGKVPEGQLPLTSAILDSLGIYFGTVRPALLPLSNWGGYGIGVFSAAKSSTGIYTITHDFHADGKISDVHGYQVLHNPSNATLQRNVVVDKLLNYLEIHVRDSAGNYVDDEVDVMILLK